MSEQVVIKLFVAGMTPAARRAISNLERVCAMAGNDHTYSVDVIDIRENPQAAEDHMILATPTAIKELPPPVRRLIGDLSDHEEVLEGLELVRH